ncbi:MAG: hypothetical protein AVO33_06230 [delta proteobacterium ML8_F1]|nr:MAG: hypothetical protein AVO33_06230 [delta proteobacterium ML8_F1]
MDQLLKTFLAFMLIPLLLRFKVKLSHTIALTAAVLILLSGIDFATLAAIVKGLLVNIPSRDTIFTVLMVSVVGGAMKHYGLLGKIIDAMISVVPSKKAVMMMIPSLIGTLAIPGGAVLSAPFVDDLGRDLNMAPSHRAAVNLIFRHVTMLLFPFSSTMLFVKSAMPEVNIYLLIFYNLVFLMLILPIAYWLYLKKVPAEKPPHREGLARELRELLAYSAPIYIPVLLNALVGLPFYLGLLLSTLLIFFQSDHQKFFKVLRDSANWHTVLIIVSVLLIKDVILEMDRLLGVFDAFFLFTSNIVLIFMLFMVTSLFFGMITGNITTPMAVTFPMLTQLTLSMGLGVSEIHIFAYFITISAFLGYYFSPLHLCQTFTLEVMKVSTGQLYKTYIPYVIGAVGVLMVSSLSLLAFVS